MFFIKRNYRILIIIVILLIVLAYVVNITSIPNSILLFRGENLDLGLIFGITLKENQEELKTVETSANVNNKVEKKKVKLSLFNVLDIKEVEINTINNTTIVPLGNSVGLKLYTSGVMVVGMTEIEGKKPYENTSIEEGDIIVEINQTEVSCTSELIECVNNSNGNDLDIKYIKDGQEYIETIAPIKTKENEYKIGLWVRDGAAGIGTITYYEPSTNKFAALGHGIVDIDTRRSYKHS